MKTRMLLFLLGALLSIGTGHSSNVVSPVQFVTVKTPLPQSLSILSDKALEKVVGTYPYKWKVASYQKIDFFPGAIGPVVMFTYVTPDKKRLDCQSVVINSSGFNLLFSSSIRTAIDSSNHKNVFIIQISDDTSFERNPHFYDQLSISVGTNYGSLYAPGKTCFEYSGNGDDHSIFYIGDFRGMGRRELLFHHIKDQEGLPVDAWILYELTGSMLDQYQPIKSDGSAIRKYRSILTKDNVFRFQMYSSSKADKGYGVDPNDSKELFVDYECFHKELLAGLFLN